jgi:hypothetical protein
MTTQIELAITIGVLVLEIGLLGLCYYRAKQPPDPLNPRILNYGLLMVILALLFLATLAHVITLLTGTQVQPRRRRGM